MSTATPIKYKAKTSSGKVVITSSPTAKIATSDGYKNITEVGTRTTRGGGSNNKNVTTTATQTTQTTQTPPVKPADTLKTIQTSAAISGQGFSVQSKQGDGYILSSGEFTTDKARAEADAGARVATVQKIQETKSADKGVFYESRINTGLPFFSKEQQKQRFKNVANVFGVGLGIKKNVVKSELGGTAGKVTEFVANKPISSAFILGTGYQLGAGFVAAGKAGLGAGSLRLASSKAGKAALSSVGKAAGGSALKKGIGYTAVNTGKQLLVQTTAGVGVVKTSELIGYSKIPQADTKYYWDIEASRSGYSETEKNLKGFFPKVSDAVSVKIGDWATRGKSQESFKTGVTQYFKSQGLTGDELDRAVKAQMQGRSSRGYGEIGSLLVTSAMTERFAQRELARYGAQQPIIKLAPKEFMKQFNKPVISTLARAGFVEGASQSITQDFSRTQPVSLKKAGLSGGVGAISAVSLGYPIIRSQVTKGKYGIIFKGVGYLTDPYEYAGDKIAAGYAKAKAAAGFKVAVPTLSLTPSSKKGSFKSATFTTTFTNTQTPSQTANNKPRKGIKTLFSFGLTSTPNDAPDYVPPKFGGINEFAPSITPSDTPSDTPSNTPANTPSNTNTNTFTNTNTRSQTTTTTNTFIPTIVTTPVNTITPQLRIPPPLPLGLDFATGAGLGGRNKGRKAYINEFTAGVAIFKGLTRGERVIEKGFIRKIKKPKVKRGGRKR